VLVDPPILQPRVAGFTNYAYRQIVRDFGGAGLQATEMVSAKGFVWHRRARGRAPRPVVGRGRRSPAVGGADVGQRPRDPGHRGGPAGPRLPGERGRYQLRLPGQAGDREGPQRSYLLRPSRPGRTDHRASGRGLRSPRLSTAKIRLGLHPRHVCNAIDVAQVVEGAGAAALTVHGRTAQDFFTGSADWERISAIKTATSREFR